MKEIEKKEKERRREGWVFEVPLFFVTITVLVIVTVASFFHPAVTVLLWIWVLTWIRVVPKNQMGAAVALGKILYFCNSGPHFLIRFPGVYIKKVPKTRFNLDFPPRAIISMGKEEEGISYGKQMLLVSCSLYTEFSRNFEAMRAIIERDIAVTPEKVTGFVDGIIDASIRLAIGGLSWKTATEEKGRKEIEKTIRRQIKAEFELDGFNVGGKETDVWIKTIDLESTELKAALVEPDRQRLQTDGAVFEAQRVEREAKVLGNLRRFFMEVGIDPSEANRLANSAFELQTTKDLAKETGQDALRIVRFQTGSGSGEDILGLLAKIAGVLGAAGGLVPPSGTKKAPSEGSVRKETAEERTEREIQEIRERTGFDFSR